MEAKEDREFQQETADLRLAQCAKDIGELRKKYENEYDSRIQDLVEYNNKVVKNAKAIAAMVETVKWKVRKLHEKIRMNMAVDLRATTEYKVAFPTEVDVEKWGTNGLPMDMIAHVLRTPAIHMEGGVVVARAEVAQHPQQPHFFYPAQ